MESQSKEHPDRIMYGIMWKEGPMKNQIKPINHREAKRLSKNFTVVEGPLLKLFRRTLSPWEEVTNGGEASVRQEEGHDAAHNE